MFNSWGSNNYGHVGIVTEVVSSDEIVIAHSNWNWDGQILTDIEVDDASGNWTSVKVYNPRIGGFGSKSFPVRGFLYPPEGTPNPIHLNHSLFESLCIYAVPYDSRCDGTDIDAWLECKDVYGGNFDVCWGNGIGGGDYETILPDFIVHSIWLENQSGKVKTVFRTGEQIKIKAKFKNTGNGDSPSDITVKFYLSEGYHVDSDKQHIDTAEIDDDDLESGETKTETEDFNVPSTPGIYNITACADTGEVVTEEHESNNCSDEAVFRVDDFGWLVPIIKNILE